MTDRTRPADAGGAGPVELARHAGAMLARLHRAGGGAADDAEALEQAGRRLWQAAAEGHACVPVDEAVAAALRASPLVLVPPDGAADGIARPLVLDGKLLYPQRFWAAETRLAANLLARARPAPLAATSAIANVLGPAPEEPDRQRRAVEHGLTHRLLLLSGGPGTGKTTTLARLVLAARALAPGLRIAVVAPTAKAAARAQQAIAAEVMATDDPGPGAQALPEGQTVHRLLGSRGPGRGFRHGPDDPLPFDLVLVDEASMIDLELADALVGALAPPCRLVLAGDRDQLASVAPGAVFAAVSKVASGPIAECTVVLERNYRQRDAAEIVAAAAQVRGGLVVRDAELAPAGPVVRHGIDRNRPAAVLAEIGERVARERAALWREIAACDRLSADLDELGRFAAQVLVRHARLGLLCALREGPLGADRLAREIDRRARQALGAGPLDAWYPGRIVIVRGNAPRSGLSNGEIGVCLAVTGAGPGTPRRLVVVFDRPGAARVVPVAEMPACDDAWALTVHQAQGSEFDTVLLVPAPAGHPLATRESLYTGMTRARSRLEIFGSLADLAWASAHPTRRESDLGRRLEIAAT